MFVHYFGSTLCNVLCNLYKRFRQEPFIDEWVTKVPCEIDISKFEQCTSELEQLLDNNYNGNFLRSTDHVYYDQIWCASTATKEPVTLNRVFHDQQICQICL